MINNPLDPEKTVSTWKPITFAAILAAALVGALMFTCSGCAGHYKPVPEKVWLVKSESGKMISLYSPEVEVLPNPEPFKVKKVYQNQIHLTTETLNFIRSHADDMEVLSLNTPDTTDEVIRSLGRMPKLETLYLYGAPVTDDIVKLFPSQFPNIKKLVVTKSLITEKGVARLKAFGFKVE